MPNHVANIITFNGDSERVEKIMDFLAGKDSSLDFNNIIPMPQTYRDYDTTNHPNGEHLVVGEKHYRYGLITEELVEQFKQATEEQKDKWGVVGWYDWSVAFWGTKWNAYDCVRESNYILFDTAWSAPLPIFARLSEMFPDIEIHVVFADEDAGNNTGELWLKEGEIQTNFPANDTEESWQLYFATHDYATDYYEKVDGHWRYKEEDVEIEG